MTIVSASATTAINTAPIPLSALADSCTNTENTHANTGTIEAIRNTLSIYPFALDGKNFNALDKVFTTTATANYSEPLNILHPLSSIKSGVKEALKCVTTQHLLGTQCIDVTSSKTARSVTYFTATHFGKGPSEGQVYYAYGQYQDSWERQGIDSWRIVYRNLVYMVGFLLSGYESELIVSDIDFL